MINHGDCCRPFATVCNKAVCAGATPAGVSNMFSCAPASALQLAAVAQRYAWREGTAYGMRHVKRLAEGLLMEAWLLLVATACMPGSWFVSFTAHASTYCCGLAAWGCCP
jgi:hypothetical protein